MFFLHYYYSIKSYNCFTVIKPNETPVKRYSLKSLLDIVSSLYKSSVSVNVLFPPSTLLIYYIMLFLHLI
nr:MAG TPA: hypothetical protein [Caudoviricetes sp.]